MAGIKQLFVLFGNKLDIKGHVVIGQLLLGLSGSVRLFRQIAVVIYRSQRAVGIGYLLICCFKL